MELRHLRCEVPDADRHSFSRPRQTDLAGLAYQKTITMLR